MTGHRFRTAVLNTYFPELHGRTLSAGRREKAMQAFGSLLFMWGGLDWFMSTDGVDVYYDWFGIYLPDAIYDYSHWIAMGLGSILFTAGNQSK